MEIVDAVVAGHLCVDIAPRIPEQVISASENFLAPGRLTVVGQLMLSTGGAVSNTGLALFKLGTNVRLVARVGDDLLGNLIREILAAQGAALVEDLRVARGEASSYTLVIDPPGVDRTFLHYPGTNDTFEPEDVPIELLARTRLLHFGYPPVMRRMYADGGITLSALFRRAKAQGVTTSLDMCMPDPIQPGGRANWRAILGEALPHVDVFLPSVEELFYMLWRDRYEEYGRTVGQTGMVDALSPREIGGLAAEALNMGAKVLVLKLGHRGLYLRTAAELEGIGRGGPLHPRAWSHRELWAPCFRTRVAGTVGAGDATIAGFLAGMLKGQTPEGTAISAVAVGACNVEVAGATSGVRSWDETQIRIAKGWPRLDAHVHAPGWAWDEAAGVWRGPNDCGAGG